MLRVRGNCFRGIRTALARPPAVASSWDGLHGGRSWYVRQQTRLAGLARPSQSSTATSGSATTPSIHPSVRPSPARPAPCMGAAQNVCGVDIKRATTWRRRRRGDVALKSGRRQSVELLMLSTDARLQSLAASAVTLMTDDVRACRRRRRRRL